MATLALLIATMAQLAHQEWALPNCEITPVSLDYGQVSPLEAPVKIVTIANRGQTALSLTPPKSTCACTKATLSDNDIAPGESVQMAVQLSLATYHSDRVDGRVFLGLSSDMDRITDIRVLATVKPEFVLEPACLDLGKVRRGTEQKTSFMVRQTGFNDVTIESVETPPGVSATTTLVKPESQGKGQPSLSDHPKAYRVDLTITPALGSTVMNTRVAVVTDVARFPRRELVIRATIVGIECSIDPKIIVFGPSKPGESIGTIEISGSDNLQILDANSSVPGIIVHAQVNQTRDHHRIGLALDNHSTQGDRFGKIALTLKEGELVEIREISLYGTVDEPVPSQLESE